MTSKLPGVARAAACAVSLVLAAAPAVRADELRVPSALVCSLQIRSVGELAVDGSYAAKSPNSTLSFTLAAIDVKAHTAQFIGNAGAASVQAMLAQRAVNFLERTDSGNIMLTTVMIEDGAAKLGAVHSRHTVMNGAAVVSQYTGACNVKN